jgi:hypothetical protein
MSARNVFRYGYIAILLIVGFALVDKEIKEPVIWICAFGAFSNLIGYIEGKVSR